jgi:hypothetical protein
VAILDDVTSTPGEYAMDVELTAQMGETNHPIRVSVPVRVEATIPVGGRQGRHTHPGTMTGFLTMGLFTMEWMED